MFYLETETINEISFLFGFITGPATILTNVVKTVVDIANIVFYGMLSLRYKPTDAYREYHAALLGWRTNACWRRPVLTRQGEIITSSPFLDPNYCKIAYAARRMPCFTNVTRTYQQLSTKDKQKIFFENAQEDIREHIRFIWVGLKRLSLGA